MLQTAEATKGNYFSTFEIISTHINQTNVCTYAYTLKKTQTQLWLIRRWLYWICEQTHLLNIRRESKIVTNRFMLSCSHLNVLIVISKICGYCLWYYIQKYDDKNFNFFQDNLFDNLDSYYLSSQLLFDSSL